MITLPGFSGNMIGLVDVAAGTPWFAVIPGASGYVTRLTKLQVDNGATANGIFLMRPLAYALVTTAQVATDTTLILDRDPSPSGNTIANLDQVVYAAADGTYRRVQVSSWSAATLTLTVGALPAAVSAGAYLWNFGVYTDTEPNTSLAFPKLDTPASAVTNYPGEGEFAVGFAGWSAGQPLMLYSPNATNATKLNFAEFARTSN